MLLHGLASIVETTGTREDTSDIYELKLKHLYELYAL